MDDPYAAIGDLSLESMALLVDAVAAIAPEAWDQPSNLAGWTIRDLVGHATGSAAKISTSTLSRLANSLPSTSSLLVKLVNSSSTSVRRSFS